ncbi:MULTISPECIES: GNAT family N-acetyltransferase [Streptomyces]|uniref:Lysine N-acyltransferase MbtK n=1 Tax=Streptomyces dengpaensis TaxID=2049881 RepID=A0ABN5I482_9ACTN|nr:MULTISPECIES: GNAT family N-acetyltransferase [Streptomyces]AVH57826.1 GNAT family N-acetyltransferase [Streptomyces dengpaensis]PIB04875.1 penicillin amidase [Streptomyces sp. HG99]
MTVQIYRDAWGIPHLRADNVQELAHAQGRAIAVDRAWQLEVERHRSQGTSAAFLGAEAVAWDRFARQARLDDTARRCFAALEKRDPETAAWVVSYVDGVNEGLVEGARRAPEFAATGLVPGRWEPWSPLGVWLGTHILFAGFPAKLWREEVVRLLGADAVELFAMDGPGTSGSNGWLVSGERTATGQAVIAGDPHRFIEDPGVYQQIRLSCPEFDVIGLAVPGVPGIAHFAHAGSVAWAITNAMADYQDLYRERLRRADDGASVEALDPDGAWRPVARHMERVDVAGGPSVEVEVIETARGPVVIGDAGGGPAEAISLRYPPRVTEDLGFGALLPLLRARQVADVDRAFDQWAEPVNVVQAADTEGGLLHRVAGKVPVRGADNRTRVVAAWEPGHEWRGWHEMPYGTVEDGVAVMANQRGPAAPLGVEFAPPHRARRIRELLDASRTWSARDMPAVHMDTHLASAAALLDRLAALEKGLSPEAVALREQLLCWDRRMEAGSAEAAAYAAVRGAVVRRLAAHPALAVLADPPAYPEVFLPWLALTPRVGLALENLLKAEELYGIDRDAVVQSAVEEVAAEGVRGTWGDTHRLAPWRALTDTSYDEPGLSGDHDCVLSTSAVPGLTDLSARGSAARYVWDLADRENSLWVVPFGADGVPGAAHHRDQLPLWVKGGLAPVITDWTKLTEPARRAMTTETTYAQGREAVHEQRLDGFGTVRILPLDPRADLDVVHSWVSQERATFWGMNGLTKEQVLETYLHLDSLDTHHAFLAVKDGEPAALFQTYEPEADRVSECYDVQPGDIGIHVLIGPAGPGGARSGYSSGLLTAFTAFVLTGLDRERVVVDPDERNAKAISRFVRQGFVPGPLVVLPEIDLPDVYLPEKRAQLAFLTREAAFADVR